LVENVESPAERVAGKRSFSTRSTSPAPRPTQRSYMPQPLARIRMATVVSDWFLNRLGYDHLQDGDKKGAIANSSSSTPACTPIHPMFTTASATPYLCRRAGTIWCGRNAQKAIELLAHDTTDPGKIGARESATARSISSVPFNFWKWRSRPFDEAPFAADSMWTGTLFLENGIVRPGPKSDKTQGKNKKKKKFLTLDRDDWYNNVP